MDSSNGDLPPQTDQEIVSTMDNFNSKTTKTSNEDSQILSPVLIVKNLVRPFTLTGLKKVLSKCGKIVDERFWLNKDKTKCYVCYESETIAEESKKYIDCLKWPASNPNTLESTFGTLEELIELIKRDEEERIQLERERREAAELEVAKQEERKQQLKEELKKKFNESLVCGDGVIEQQINGDSNNSISKHNNVNKPTIIKNEEDDQTRVREVSPHKNPITNVLYITNLVRGFTEKQLKELLSRHGKLIEEKFWIDKLKSKCYVVYESNDDALKARNSIHGLKWPRANTKTLRADFGKLGDVNDLLNGESVKAKDDKPINKETVTYNAKEEVKLNDQQQFKSNSVSKKQEESKENVDENRKKSPAKNPISCIVYVNGLSRPFTLPQLNEILCEDGPHDEKRFWIDRVKSQCYAAYENEEIAIKTRERLHGLWWPKGNNRKLVADFASEKELEDKLKSNKLDKANRELQQKIKEEENRNREKSDRNNERHQADASHENVKDKRYDEEMVVDRNETQDHVNVKRRRERSASPTPRKRDHRIEQSPNEQINKKIDNVKESPGKTLETLFKKTKTTPSIYWMPLTEEGMKLRDELREKQRIDRVERLERVERIKREAAERVRAFNDFNRRRSPPRREQPYHPSRNYRPPSLSRYPTERDRFTAEARSSRTPYRSPARMDYSDKRMIERPPQRELRSPERIPRPIRTPNRRSPEKQERGRRLTPVGRNSRSRSDSSSAGSTKSSGSSSSSGSHRRSSPARRSPARRSPVRRSPVRRSPPRRSPPRRSPPRHSPLRRSPVGNSPIRNQNKRPMVPSPRSPIRRYSRSPPRRYGDRRMPPTRR